MQLTWQPAEYHNGNNTGKPSKNQQEAESSSATCIVVGGAGKLGRVLCRRLVSQGHRVVAFGRSMPDDNEFEQSDTLSFQPCDLLDADKVRNAVARAASSAGELRIYQCAGSYHVGLLNGSEWAGAEAVLAPKIQGTMNLHYASLEHNVTQFVLFSSASSVFGSLGQAFYAAGNSFLDRFQSC